MSSRKRGDMNPKLHMDRQPTIARITDPSLLAGKRREIDNVMKKARANTNDYWDKKLIEVEEKDPNRWRHTGYKKMYIQGESSSPDSDREGPANIGGYKHYNSGGGVGVGGFPPNSRYPGNLDGRSRSRSHSRFASPPSPHQMRRRSPPHGGGGGNNNNALVDGIGRRMSPSLSLDGGPPHRGRPRSPLLSRGIPPRSPSDMVGRGRGMGVRPRSPPEPSGLRGRKSRSPIGGRHRSPPVVGNHRRSPPNAATMLANKRNQILPRSKRPPSPPPRNSCRSHSNSSMSSCSDDSCSVCSPKRPRSRSHSHMAGVPRSPPTKSSRAMQYRGAPSHGVHPSTSRVHGRPMSPTAMRAMEKYRNDEKAHRDNTRERSSGCSTSEIAQLKMSRVNRHSPPNDARAKNRPPEPPEPSSSSDFANVTPKKKKKEKEVRPRIKIEGEKHSKRVNSSSESEDSGGSDSESSLPTFTATTRLTLSERFGKMAQWSIDRSNMENMRITKDSSGGALKVMIAEASAMQLSPPRRFSYSPAPVGHYPEELATVAPTGLISWDDVRVRYEYYKSRGYLRDLDLKDYVKWEEWWYKYQEWLKQERYYEYWERQQMARRRRKKLPITQRLN